MMIIIHDRDDPGPRPGLTVTVTVTDSAAMGLAARLSRDLITVNHQSDSLALLG
jgi:hypothetical protein